MFTGTIGFLSVLCLLILVVTGWFSTFLDEIEISRRHFGMLLCSIFFLMLLPPIPLTKGISFQVTVVVLVCIQLTLLYEISSHAVILVIGSSAVLGVLFAIWNFLNIIYPSVFQDLLSGVQLLLAFGSAFFLGSHWKEKWSILFGILFYNHLADLIESAREGQAIEIGANSFLNQVSIAIILFVLGQTFFQRIRTKKVSSIR